MCPNFRPFGSILLTPQEMAQADKATEASGIPVALLMEQAGRAVAASALRHYPGALRFIVVCGAGNNGGDGLVAAAALQEAGAAVEIFALASEPRWKGVAQAAYERYSPVIKRISDYVPASGDVIIDAIFGAGLARDVPQPVAELIKKVEASELPVLAIDLPSGVDGLTGAIRGSAFKAERTITFMSRKPGHLLMPGRGLCGKVEVAEIGLPKRVVSACAKTVMTNDPDVWLSAYPSNDNATHKYKRGHLAVFSGGVSHTGAARMTSAAGLSAGAGLVTVASSKEAMLTNAAALTAVMVRQVDNAKDVENWLESAKLHSFVIGPGFGVGQTLRDFVAQVTGRPTVLDADAITSFAEAPEQLFALLKKCEGQHVLTPHEGEFGRLFPDLADNEDMGKLEKAKLAAERMGAVLVYKGPDTVIASPDGPLLINENAPAWLATAGSGDVLAGIVGAHLAQGMPAFEAAACSVWLHGEAASQAGPGMTAEDLIKHIPAALASLNARRKAFEARGRRSGH